MSTEERKPMNVKEGNKIIAEFMGDKSYASESQLNYWLLLPEKKLSRWVNIVDIKYHSSWDWLMPVVEKIYKTDLKSLNDNTKYGNPITAAVEYVKSIRQTFTDVSIIKTWQAVIAFIKWYNQQSK